MNFNAFFRRLIGKSTVQVGVINAISGLGFAGANLVLAWVLESEQYGLVALVIALSNIAIGLGPMGLQGVIVRQLIRFDRRLLTYSLAASLLPAALATGFGYLAYGLSGSILILMSAAVVAGSLTQVAAAGFQVKHRFVIATGLGQFGNLGLAITSVIVLIAAVESPLLPLFLIAISFAAAAGVSLIGLMREKKPDARQIRFDDWSDAISITGLTAAGQVLMQLERILIPEFMTLATLATFGVMAALVISPYRSLEVAVGFTMIPRLRATDDRHARKRLVMIEAFFAGALCVGGGVVLWFVALPVSDWIYGDRYPITSSLVLAGIVAGTVKVGSSLCRSMAIAFCSTRELWKLAWFSWLAVALGIIGAYVGASWGLTGIVYGASVGFIVRAVASVWISVKYFEEYSPPVSDRGSA